MPLRLTLTTAFHCSNVRSSIGIAGAPMPALLNSISRRPQVCFTLAKIALTVSGLPMSPSSTSARAPAPESAAVLSISSLRRPTSATLQPSPSSASAAALPMPVPAPVTSATLLVAAMARSPPFFWNEDVTAGALRYQRNRATLQSSAGRPSAAA